MKGLEKLPFISNEQKTLLIQSYNQYKRFGRIYFEVVDCDKKTISVKITQQNNPANKYLGAEDLVNRATEVFKPVCNEYGFMLAVFPLPYFNNALDSLSIEYVRQKQAEFNISDVELSRLIGIRKENMSRILNDKRGLTKWHKAAFYYLFESMKH